MWYFRRWLSSTLYQTAATFALGGRPLYVESPLSSISIWLPFCNPTCPVCHLLCCPAHTKRLHCSVCVAVWSFVCILIWECYTCICVDVSCLFSMFILMPCCWCQCLLQSFRLLLVWSQWVVCCLLDNNWTFLCCQEKMLHLLKAFPELQTMALLKVWPLPVSKCMLQGWQSLPAASGQTNFSTYSWNENQNLSRDSNSVALCVFYL